MKKKEPLISIVLPIYNVEKYLSNCIESVLIQTYKNLEVILVDDGATDSCGKICDEYAKKDDRIVVYHKENGGLSDARNYGLERCKGEYITFIDSDDYVDSDYVMYLYSTLIKYKTKMSICQHKVHYDNGKIKNLGHEGDEKLTSKECLERMLYHDVIDTSAWAKLYRTDLFDNVRYPKGKIFEDIGTTYKLMLTSEQIACGYEAKYHYIFHENSIVNSSFSVRKLDMIEMTDEMAENVLKIYPELYDAVVRRQIYARFSTLNQMLDVRDEKHKKVRADIIRYLKTNSVNIMKNSKTPKRDKIASMLLKLGFPIYKTIYKVYVKY